MGADDHDFVPQQGILPFDEAKDILRWVKFSFDVDGNRRTHARLRPTEVCEQLASEVG